jgi:hypothetical protein
MATTSLQTSGISNSGKYNTSEGLPRIPSSTSGGTLYGDDLYFYRAFRASGTFTVGVRPLAVDLLIVAGGGGATTGGGGAGGVRRVSTTLAIGSYTVTIGAGGAGAGGGGTGSNGSNSSFGDFSAIGGGGGGPNDSGAGARSGGSGGGGGATSTVITYGGLGTDGQGCSGGTSRATASPFATAGGGGAGGSGFSPVNNSTGGDGGDGSTAFSAWAIATGSGERSAFGGGGGGGVFNGALYGEGGIGGGGNALGTPAALGMINTGGGGGGGSNAGGGAGGSGIVIVRYLKTSAKESVSTFWSPPAANTIQLAFPFSSGLGLMDYSPIINPDSQGQKRIRLVNSPTTSATTSKFYGSSYFSDAFANVRYVAVENDSRFWLENKDFTIELWAYHTSVSVGYQALVSHSSDTADAQNGWIFYLEANNTINFLSSAGSGWNGITCTSTTIPTVNTWSHFAVSRSGNTTRMFYNGTQIGSSSFSGSVLRPTARELRVGSYNFFPGGQRGMNGYLQDVILRVGAGAGIYTSNFTPSNTPLYLGSGV